MDKTKQIITKAYLDRARKMLALQQQGWTLRMIGDRFDLSYEAVRLALQKLNKEKK